VKMSLGARPGLTSHQTDPAGVIPWTRRLVPGA
jgi:hypothetical protein